MARGFTDREREIIRNDLIKAGRELFGAYGLKKTSIEDLTKAVGIAQGSFYTFFNSKEELYLEVMDREGEAIKEQLLKEDDIKELTRDKFKSFFKKVFEVVSSNPIIRQMFFEEEVDILIRKIPPEKMKEYNKRLMRDFLPIIKKWQDEGAIINDYKPEVIVALFQVLYHPILYKKDFDENVYDDMLQLLVDIVAKGLVVE
ncbi:MAG TPA: TetR/AcrR family transcriptional regulator [Thermoanaerobacterales bacterium]|uniref:TetR/AcrR family transcriptional regulator n=1 Tax=Tepidanaerobacter sp. GT38 TaxID=2722793 RepID=UPI00184543C6|nr:TetR/AcrR family transcriptional regulator [Tepidanaerobacter sp. GT38]MCG1013279.1 TetR/AcrR family transcriptional regulator [Tepidanaerobacter sp. GT38]HHY41725.1 TetR/AcrR family transcriptional regulator [Thermoanaerobacterales bacterium]